MKRAIIPLIMLLSLTTSFNVHAASVSALNGNVVYTDDLGSARQLTNTGLDTAPVLSPDGQRVAFIRQSPGQALDTYAGSVTKEDIWLVDANASNAHAIVNGRSHKEPEQILAGFSNLVFSPDGQMLYFSSSAWTTSYAVHGINLVDAKEHFITDGDILAVVPSGRYKGFLAVHKHKYWLAGGSYDWYWLVSPEGKEIGPIGPEDNNLDEFLKQNE